MDVKHETLVLLLGFKPTTENKNIFWFWEKFDNSNENNWKEEFEYLTNIWRYGDSILIDFYFFLKKYYPYAIPYSLFFSYKNKEWENDVNYFRQLSGLANKWLMDIFSGESFYSRNKEYFTRAEIKYFLTCDWQNIDSTSKTSSYRDFIYHYFDSKLKTRNIKSYADTFMRHGDNLHLPAADYLERRNEKSYIDTFMDKFQDCFTNPIVRNYFDFVCNNQKHFGEDEVADTGDFLKSEYISRGLDFDFKGHTWQNLRQLSLEWHTAERYKDAPFLQEKLNAKWEKTIGDFTHVVENKTWTIKEITSGKLLSEEGEDMHHCVFSYVENCIKGYRKIFSVRCMDDKVIDMKKAATLEIDNDMRIMQARGRFNEPIDEETVEIILKWGDENNINCDYEFKTRDFNEEAHRRDFSYYDDKYTGSIKDIVYKTDKKTWKITRKTKKDTDFDFSEYIPGGYNWIYGNYAQEVSNGNMQIYLVECINDTMTATLIISKDMELVKVISTRREVRGEDIFLNKEIKEIINIWTNENLIKWDSYFEEEE